VGTIGLSFGNPSSGQGIDVNATVTQIVSQLQNTETPFKTQLTALQSQDTAISSLGSLLSTLSTSIQVLTDPAGILSGKQGSSSDPNTLALLSASTQATAGSHSVLIQQLAQTSTFASNAIRATDALSGSLTLHVGSGASTSIAVDPANATLSGLAAAINRSSAGVSASVITDSNGARLSLVSQSSGADGQISIDSNSLNDGTTGSALSLTAGQSGQDALLTVDGVGVSSASNTVSTVIPGVTFQLLGVSSNPVQVEIANDTQSVSSGLSTLVTNYNAVVSALSTQEGKDASGNPEPLFGLPIISSLQQALSRALLQPAGTSLNSITQLGLSLNGDGTLSLNTDQLTQALNSNYSGVQSFFQDANGFGLNFENAVDAAGTAAPASLLSQAQSANAATESSLNNTVSTIDARIATQKTALTTELNQANQTLQAIPQQLNAINEIYSAITGFNQQPQG
jgi:flagellar hook-associated protein 2